MHKTRKTSSALIASHPIKDLGVKEEDVAKIFFLSCQPVHAEHRDDNSCAMCRLLEKFKESLEKESMQPLMRELKVKTLRMCSLDVPLLEMPTLESNFADLDDAISVQDEELLTFTEVLQVVGYPVPALLQEKLEAVLSQKRIPARHTRRSSAGNENQFLSYTFNKNIGKICESLSAEEVYALRKFITQQGETHEDMKEMAEAVSVIKSVASLQASKAMKDAAFYYMILFMFKSGNLTSLYTHQLESYLEAARSLLDKTKPRDTEHITKAIGQLKRYQITNKPPGVCMIFAMLEGREDGSKTDVADVKALFETEFNYDVLIKINPSVKDVKSLIAKLGESRNMFYDSLVVWFMAHGDKTHLFVKDGQIHRRTDLIQPFVDIDWLKTKPKLFFIQACANRRPRSYAQDSRGMRTSTDAVALGIDAGDEWKKKYLPHADFTSVNNFADTLVCYATMWYQPAARNEEGSMFIQTLLDALRRKGTDTCIENVLRETTYRMNSIVLRDDSDRTWRQTPYYESSLQKEFVFPKEN
ncbi:uncharacterized protein LOC108675143 isoform X2 [Hyalella azteca]|uniref:Uncharacterized protein LOC108675143 isoform X2 n=1 Tax=Hyalella azteca TaxID=294128 RepID=A0A8B7NY02_HYAAZ|nr:uncharacterized protein LOC108675143 isoform X2 [Hyalella azteca]